MTRFVLASASPGRLATLHAAGIEPEVVVSSVDESEFRANTVADLVEQLAIAKAVDVAGRTDAGALVLGCDSLLDLDGRAVGKLATSQAAIEQWQAIRGRRAVLRTGHALIDTARDEARSAVASTTVSFAPVTDAEITAYVGTGEPLRCAGGFTIDGLGGWFIEGVGGDHHNVVGLSLPTLRSMLLELGYQLTDLGYPAGSKPIR
ncbi:MAG TPA: Maf family protein [Jatrophihabitantaceae bacterium]|nr:Maf family protein [Jatrophihabitantaceae bacterium]